MARVRIILLFVVFLFVATVQAWDEGIVGVSNRLNPTTDYALINGKVYTVDEAQPWAEAVAIEGDTITYVGDAAGLKRFIGLSTEVIDLKGKMVLPGFVEGHIHPVAGGMMAKGIDLQTDDRDKLFHRMRTYVTENPGLDVIVGYGVRFNIWTDGWPTAEMIDKIESERPVYFWGIDVHTAWVNSKALEIAGIDKNTPDTVPGYSYFERDENGNPTGWLVEFPAQLQVLSALVDLNTDYIAAGVAEWMPKFSAAGITTVHDYGILGLTAEEGFQLFTDLEKEGKLPIRLQGSYFWNDPNIDPIPELQALKKQFNSEQVKARSIKINLDGGDDKWNALYVEPYSDRPNVVPEPIIPYDILNDVVQRADAAGINLTCHCFGDLAVRKLLDAVELTIKANPERDRRVVISHATLVHPNDIPRFGELGVTYDTTGAWMSLDPLLQTVSTVRLGRDRVNAMFPTKAIAEAGGNVSFGSDWPASGYISEYRPLYGIRTAVTRQLPGRDDVPPLGGDAAKVPLDMAIRANTLGAAYGMAMDDQVGSIEVGKKADLVVLDKNLFEIEPHDIHKVKVLYTVMGGELVYEADSDE